MSYQLPAALRRQDVFGTSFPSSTGGGSVNSGAGSFDSSLDSSAGGSFMSTPAAVSSASEALRHMNSSAVTIPVFEVESENDAMLAVVEKAVHARRVDPQNLINRFTPNFLAAPVGAKRLAEVTFAPRDRTLVYQPRMIENTANDAQDFAPLLSNNKRVIDALDDAGKEKVYPVRRFAQASGSTAARVPSYVPFAVRKLGHNEIRWQPPPTDRTMNDVQTSIATVVESAIPPTTRRNVNEEYALRKRLVAYDDSETFGFVPRPIDCVEVLDHLIDEFFSAQERGEAPIDAKPQMVVHGLKLFCFNWQLTAAVWFQPSNAVRGTTSGGWQLVQFEDASRFVYSAIPPASCVIVPLPNQPYMVTATAKTLFLLDLADHCWHALPVVGLHDFVTFSWMHVIDDKTLYVLSGSRKLHGIIKLEEPVQEVEIMKRGGSSKLFDPEFQTPIQGTRLRGTPCQDALVPVQNVPGLAYCSAKGEGHTWLFYFNTVARNFIPWQRLDCESFISVAMKDHLDLDSWTVLFFSERLIRIDLGKEVSARLQPGSTSSAPAMKSLPSSTQRVLKATHRLVIKNPPGAVGATGAVESNDHTDKSPTQRSTWRREEGGSGVANRVIRISPFIPLGATDANFQSRMTFGLVDEKDSTVVMKLRLSEVTIMCPMFNRCIAVVSYDKKAFVPIEVDRRLYTRRLAGEDVDELDTLDPARL